MKTIVGMVEKVDNATLGPPERVCPVCGPHQHGAVTLSGFVGTDAALNGDYCLRCYARWLASMFPKLGAPA